MAIPNENFPGTCVSKEGKFIYGIHNPRFKIQNLREKDFVSKIGSLDTGDEIFNKINFPLNDVEEKNADIIYEIPNPFPFRGTTYINSKWADTNAKRPDLIRIEKKESCSFKESIKNWLNKKTISEDEIIDLIKALPRPMRIAIAESSTDPDELVLLANTICKFVFDKDNKIPINLVFKKDKNNISIPDIKDHVLFEIIANNPCLPDVYKKSMVLIPGIQGTSEITADQHIDNKTHVFEYLRRNSYIPWGHFAANMADDSIRYRAKNLVLSDMEAMRFLYYQRTYIRLAEQLDIVLPQTDIRKSFSSDMLEHLRKEIVSKLLKNTKELEFNRSLWGWNYGFGFSHSGYNLHASHQQIHQQYAMIPKYVKKDHIPEHDLELMPCYSSGDLMEKFVNSYRKKTGRGFFKNYLSAIKSNTRTDNNSLKDSNLIVFEDDFVVLFVPKAQTSQFELQLMPKKQCGNILEADIKMRRSIDKAILTSIQTLEALGARMVTSIEFSKRFDLNSDHDQQLIYSFLPKIPMSPGAFSEAQLRYINGHYPEDFANVCRNILSQ